MSRSFFNIAKAEESRSSSTGTSFHFDANARHNLDGIISSSGSNIDRTELIDTNKKVAKNNSNSTNSADRSNVNEPFSRFKNGTG